MRKRTSKNRLTLTYSLTIFLILLGTVGIVLLISLLINWLWPTLLENLVIYGIFLLLVLSMILGTLFSSIYFNQYAKIVDNFLIALDEMSNGNFNYQIEEKYSGLLRDVAIKFNATIKELNSVELLKEDFARNFSHEFKTPIVSIRGFAKLLMNPSLSDEDKTEYSKIIYEESNRLANLASNILLISKLESQAIVSEKNKFFIDEQIREVVILLEKQWIQKNITININQEQNISYFGNEDLLKQIWINLLDNAIKFSNENGNIEINSSIENENIIVAIKDFGIGMSDETSSHIFERYFQNDKSRSYDGNGLGLSIVKEIINLHKGQIIVKTTLNEGSTFIITLPNSI